MKPWKSLGLCEIPSSSEETTEKVSAPGGTMECHQPSDSQQLDIQVIPSG